MLFFTLYDQTSLRVTTATHTTVTFDLVEAARYLNLDLVDYVINSTKSNFPNSIPLSLFFSYFPRYAYKTLLPGLATTTTEHKCISKKKM